MIPEDELQQMYWDKEMSQPEIAEFIGVSQHTVYYWMQKYDIESRTVYESLLVKSSILPIPISKEELADMYWGKGMSMLQIAKEINMSQYNVHNWMKIYEIERRTISESLVGKFAGESNGNWNGGTSFDPYCNKFNRAFKESIRKRDDYTCQLCGCEQKLGGQRLDVHHVHYDRENCYPDVVALCRSCNSAVNSNRDYWEQYFEDLLVERRILNCKTR